MGERVSVVTQRVCLCLRAASGSMEDIGALSLALQIIDASQELQETVAHLKKLMPSASDRHAEQMQPGAHGRSLSTPTPRLYITLCGSCADHGAT